eukprot:COSAG02_NODE_151_length_33583_cov_25.995042_18_plen_88_part_00
MLVCIAQVATDNFEGIQVVLTEVRDSEPAYRTWPSRLYIESTMCVEHNRIANRYVNIVIPAIPQTMIRENRKAYDNPRPAVYNKWTR